MLEGVKQRWLAAKVMAEIKAQYPDQDFVNRLFSTDWVGEHLSILGASAYYRKDKDAPFLYACHVLHEGARDQSLDNSTRSICLALLADRLTKAKANPHYWLRHIMIFGDLAETVEEVASET